MPAQNFCLVGWAAHFPLFRCHWMSFGYAAMRALNCSTNLMVPDDTASHPCHLTRLAAAAALRKETVCVGGGKSFLLRFALKGLSCASFEVIHSGRSLAKSGK